MITQPPPGEAREVSIFGRWERRNCQLPLTIAGLRIWTEDMLMVVGLLKKRKKWVRWLEDWILKRWWEKEVWFSGIVEDIYIVGSCGRFFEYSRLLLESLKTRNNWSWCAGGNEVSLYWRYCSCGVVAFWAPWESTPHAISKPYFFQPSSWGINYWFRIQRSLGRRLAEGRTWW